jgi:hypothetical protein
MQISRKGIYQEYDEAGTPLTDERWQVVTLPDGSIHIENETVRRKPSPEVRSDSMTCVLDKDMRLLDFSIFGLFAKRESRICIVNAARDAATLCWRHEGDVNERAIAWHDGLEIDWQTPLLNMITIWRSALAPGQSRRFEAWLLEPVSFEPHKMVQVYANHGDEAHDTYLGRKLLTRYTLDFGGDGTSISNLWCDSDGVIHDFVTRFGGWRLMATDV